MIKYLPMLNYFHTLFCRSMLAPAFSSSETTSVIPFLAANISAEYPFCVMTDMCSETLMTSQKGSSCSNIKMVRVMHCQAPFLLVLLGNTYIVPPEYI